MKPKVALPAHVPAELAYDFDFYEDPRFAQGTLECVMELAREAPPIFYSPYLSFPVGDARKALLAFAALVDGRVPPLVEKWDEQLLT